VGERGGGEKDEGLQKTDCTSALVQQESAAYHEQLPKLKDCVGVRDKEFVMTTDRLRDSFISKKCAWQVGSKGYGEEERGK